MEKINLIACTILITVILVSTVSAFGVASPFWKDNPLKLNPGESRTVKLNLQNMDVTADDLDVRVDLAEGSEVVTLSKNDYEVKAGTKDTEIILEVAVPANAAIGTKYRVTVSSKTVTPGGAAVVFGTAMDTTFDVEVVPKPAPKPEVKEEAELPETGGSLLWIVGVIVVVVLVVIYFAMKKKKVDAQAKK